MKKTIFSILVSIFILSSCGSNQSQQEEVFTMSDSELAVEDSIASASIDSLGGVADTTMQSVVADTTIQM
jgi:hypothetical protein